MKSILLIIAIFLFFSVAFSFALGLINVNNTRLLKFQDKNWYLSEVIIGTTGIRINRDNKPSLIYTIMFNSERFTGIGAYSRYFGPYSVKKDHSLLLKRVTSTRLGSKYETDNFNEREYFTYIEKVTRWEIRNGKLELYSSNDDGEHVILVYY
ncbi:META domain-containing protein [Treponema sp. R80B11-R83G3]